MKSLQELINKHGDQEMAESEFKELFGIKTEWKPEEYEPYWYVDDSMGDTFESVWTDSLIGHSRWEMGNVYQSEEKAIFARDKKRFLVKMERDFEDNSEPIDWGNIEQWKRSVRFDYGEQRLFIDVTARYKTLDLYTTNKEWLQQYIKDNEVNIKKYVFGVETQSEEE